MNHELLMILVYKGTFAPPVKGQGGSVP